MQQCDTKTHLFWELILKCFYVNFCSVYTISCQYMMLYATPDTVVVYMKSIYIHLNDNLRDTPKYSVASNANEEIFHESECPCVTVLFLPNISSVQTPQMMNEMESHEEVCTVGVYLKSIDCSSTSIFSNAFFPCTQPVFNKIANQKS